VCSLMHVQYELHMSPRTYSQCLFLAHAAAGEST